MPENPLLRYLPTRTELRKNRALKPIAHLLHEENLWHMNRRSVSGAVFIGLFTAFLPLPGQMIIAALLAVTTGCNLPLAVGLVWISNPLTMPPMFYFAYRLGAWLLGWELETDAVELSFDWLWQNFAGIGYPLLIGSLVCGWVGGATGFVITRLVWRLKVLRRWRERRELRRRLRAPS